MKTTEAIGYIDKIICDQERYEEKTARWMQRLEERDNNETAL